MTATVPLQKPDQGLLSDYAVIILAAGLGKRLAPLTHLLPKPASPLLNRPICLSMIKQLIAAGASTIHINSSHLAENLENEIVLALSQELQTDADSVFSRIRFWRETNRLETGGAIVRIWKALESENRNLGADLKKPISRGILVVSGDIVGTIPLQEMIQAWELARRDHLDSSNLSQKEAPWALMATKNLKEARADVTWVHPETNTIAGFGRDVEAPQNQYLASLFSNYQIIDERALEGLSIEHNSSINLIYRPLLKRGKRILALAMPDSLEWHNVGTPHEYFDCSRALSKTLTPQAQANHVLDHDLDRNADHSWSGVCLCPKVIGQDLHVFKQVISLRGIQPVLSMPKAYAIEEGQEKDFHEALARFILEMKSMLERGDESFAEGSGSLREDCGSLREDSKERLTLWIRVPDTFPIQVPQPIFVGACLFFERALSQRGALKETVDWVDFLFTDSQTQVCR